MKFKQKKLIVSVVDVYNHSEYGESDWLVNSLCIFLIIFLLFVVVWCLRDVLFY